MRQVDRDDGKHYPTRRGIAEQGPQRTVEFCREVICGSTTTRGTEYRWVGSLLSCSRVSHRQIASSLFHLSTPLPVDRDAQRPKLLKMWDAGGLARRCLQPSAFLQHLFHHWR